MNNSSNPDIQQRLTQVAKSVSTALNNCVNCLPGQNDVDDAIRNIANANQILNSKDVHEHQVASIPESSFVDYQPRMVTNAEEIAGLAQEMIVKSNTDSSQLGPLAAKLAQQFSNLANDTRGAVASTFKLEVVYRIKTSVQDLGTACIDLTRSAGSCQSNPTDTYSQRGVSDNARVVTEKVSFVLAALQAGSHGHQACINVASTVSGIIGDLDTTIMFATAGTLHAENENETFSDHKENILKTSKALVEDTKILVAGAASSQEQLAVAAQNAVNTIIQFAEVVKLGAASLGSNNPEAQIHLINAVKDVATALGVLVQATKAASDKSIHDPAMIHLRDSAKVMVTNVASLLKTVKSAEDSWGTRALESTIDAIGQEINAYDSNDPPMRSATVEDLLRATNPVTLATAKAVAAADSCKQDDIIAAANMGRKAIFDLLIVSKAAAFTSETTELRTRTLQTGHNCAVHYRELLQMVHRVIQKPTVDGKQQLETISRTIAQSVQDVVSCAESLKVAGSDWDDPDEPMVIAETELKSAAITIDAAAKKLANLKPRISKHHETGLDETMNFDEMILKGAKSIAAATSALVKAASDAQRELVTEGKVGAHTVYTSDDGQWSKSLISAAILVAAATHSLVEAANSLVQGHAYEEKLISFAKQIASFTAQLLVACKVKADPDSQTTHRLLEAGNTVKKAIDNLVRAAQQAIEHDKERSLIINKRMVGGIPQDIVAGKEIIRLERELEVAREKLAAIRKATHCKKFCSRYQVLR